MINIFFNMIHLCDLPKKKNPFHKEKPNNESNQIFKTKNKL